MLGLVPPPLPCRTFAPPPETPLVSVGVSATGWASNCGSLEALVNGLPNIVDLLSDLTGHTLAARWRPMIAFRITPVWPKACPLPAAAVAGLARQPPVSFLPASAPPGTATALVCERLTAAYPSSSPPSRVARYRVREPGATRHFGNFIGIMRPSCIQRL